MTLLESLLALMCWVTLTTLCAQVLQQHSRKSAALSTAQLLKKTGHSVRAYMEDHPYETNLKKISKSKLIDAGYFFPHKHNAYQQLHNLQAVQDGSQTHACIITHGGKPIPLGDWSLMEPLLEGYGGYCESQTNIIGWQQRLNPQFTSLLQPGHLLLCYPLQTSQLPSVVSAPDQLLYRKKIPTHPQYQQMKTTLNMEGSAIVFKAPQQQGSISAQGVEFTHTTPAGPERASIKWSSRGDETGYQLTLQAPGQHHVRISPSAIQMTAPSIVTRHRHSRYDTVNRTVTVTTIPPHYGLQWHREWHQLPYHHLPYHQLQRAEERQKELNQAAQRICLLQQRSQTAQLKQPARKSSLHPHLGRMFIVGNFYQQQSTVFICGKSPSTQEAAPLAYPIFSTAPTLRTDPSAPLPASERTEEKEVVGLTFYDINDPNQLDKLDQDKKFQLYLFLYDSIEKILFFLNLEKNILRNDKPKDIKNKDLVNFIQDIEKYKKSAISLENFKENKYLKSLTDQYKKLPSPYFNQDQTNIPELLINYFLHRSIEKTAAEKRGNATFLQDLLTQLKSCTNTQSKANLAALVDKYYKKELTPKEEERVIAEVTRVIKDSSVNTFLSELMDFKRKLKPYSWMQTVYVLSTAQYSGNDPLCELNLTDLPLR